MREILFRAKAINRDNGFHRTNYKNGDWVCGLITRLYHEHFENLPAEMTDMSVSGIEVDYKTIGQYTGLTDENGAEIFEGDIVSCQMWCGDEYSDGRQNWYVSFKDGSFVIDKDCYVPKKLSHNNIRSYDIKVIGNIHDNPELLKGGE